MFNRKKKKIAELEARVADLEKLNDHLLKRNDLLEWKQKNPPRYEVGEEVIGLEIDDVFTGLDFSALEEYFSQFKPNSLLRLPIFLFLAPMPIRTWKYELKDLDTNVIILLTERELVSRDDLATRKDWGIL